MRDRINLASDKLGNRYDRLANSWGFKERDKEWFYNSKMKKVICPKLSSQWDGQYLVINRLNAVVYRVQPSQNLVWKLYICADWNLFMKMIMFCELLTETIQFWRNTVIKTGQKHRKKFFVNEPICAYKVVLITGTMVTVAIDNVTKYFPYQWICTNHNWTWKLDMSLFKYVRLWYHPCCLELLFVQYVWTPYS